MPSRNKNFIILPKSWSGHGRTGSAGPETIWQETADWNTKCYKTSHHLHIQFKQQICHPIYYFCKLVESIIYTCDYRIQFIVKLIKQPESTNTHISTLKCISLCK